MSKRYNGGPDLAVIDGAIRGIASGRNHYCCIALSNSAAGAGCDDWGQYTRQFRLFVVMVFGGGDLPYWWNSGKDHKKERLAALRAFRQACIDAAKVGGQQ